MHRFIHLLIYSLIHSFSYSWFMYVRTDPVGTPSFVSNSFSMDWKIIQTNFSLGTWYIPRDIIRGTMNIKLGQIVSTESFLRLVPLKMFADCIIFILCCGFIFACSVHPTENHIRPTLYSLRLNLAHVAWKQNLNQHGNFPQQNST